MKVKIKYPKTKCKYCGNTFTKQHPNQVYCSPYCQKEGNKEKTRKRFHKWYNKNKKRHWAKKKGTGYLGPHRHTDPEKEKQMIQKEFQRLQISKSLE